MKMTELIVFYGSPLKAKLYGLKFERDEVLGPDRPISFLPKLIRGFFFGTRIY